MICVDRRHQDQSSDFISVSLEYKDTVNGTRKFSNDAMLRNTLNVLSTKIA